MAVPPGPSDSQLLAGCPVGKHGKGDSEEGGYENMEEGAVLDSSVELGACSPMGFWDPLRLFRLRTCGLDTDEGVSEGLVEDAGGTMDKLTEASTVRHPDSCANEFANRCANEYANVGTNILADNSGADDILADTSCDDRNRSRF